METSTYAQETDMISKWRANPETFFVDVLGIDTLEDYQIDLLHKIAANQRVTVRACHSVGKTWTLARVALWFYTCFDDSIIISTAPTFNQVEALLWGELRDAFKKSKHDLGGTLLTTSLKKSDKWYCKGFSPQKKAGESDEQLSSSMSGFHSKYVLVIFDEATGIPADIWKMAEGLMTSGVMVRFVAIANPTTRSCEFFKTFSSARYVKVHLSCFNSRNLRVNGFYNFADIDAEIERLLEMPEESRLIEIQKYKKPVPHLVSAQWVLEFVLEYGIDHPLVMSKVFGNFPDDDENALIKMTWVEDAMARDIPYDKEELRCIGIDVARRGEDKSVLVEMIGKKQTAMEVGVKQVTTVIAKLAIRMINNEYLDHRTIVLVDATGIGAGVYDMIVEAKENQEIGKNVQIIEVHFGASSVNPDEKDKEEIERDRSRYANLKAKMYQLLANDLKDHIDIFDDVNFIKELPMIKLNLNNTKGKLEIESKKRAGSKSPDFADALLLANYGRYVSITYGSFKNLKIDQLQPLIKRKKHKQRTTRIKSTSY